MRWRSRDNSIWRPWFAWSPIKIAGDWVWLEWLEVRGPFYVFPADAMVHEFRFPEAKR